jgi:hypothetical protein
MKRLLVLSCFILLVSLMNLTAQVTDGSKNIPVQREKWIEESVSELGKFIPDSSVKLIAPYLIDQEDAKKLYFKVNKEGMIKLENGDWIYIITHSGHENEEIGDLCLAIDNKKDVYINESHVCGGVIRFESSGLTELKSTDDFFLNFESDTDSKRWDKLLSLKNQPE